MGQSVESAHHVGQLFISIFRAVACSPVDIGRVFFEQFGGTPRGLAKPSTDTPRDVLHRYKAVALESKPRRAGVEGGRVRDLVETALGVVPVACLGLAALLLPCALIDIAAGTTLLGSVTMALLLCFSAAAILGVVAVQQRRYADKSGHRSSENKGIADNGGTADVPIKAIGAGVSRQAVASGCWPSGTPANGSCHSLLSKKQSDDPHDCRRKSNKHKPIEHHQSEQKCPIESLPWMPPAVSSGTRLMRSHPRRHGSTFRNLRFGFVESDQIQLDRRLPQRTLFPGKSLDA